MAEVSVPLTIHEAEFAVTATVSKPTPAYSDERGSFGPLETDIEVIGVFAAEAMIVDPLEFVRDWLDAHPAARAEFEADCCIEAGEQDAAMREAAAEAKHERWLEARGLA